MRTTKTDIVFPYKMTLTEQGKRLRVFQESKAGINVTFKFTLEEADNFSYVLENALRVLKEHIQRAKERT